MLANSVKLASFTHAAVLDGTWKFMTLPPNKGSFTSNNMMLDQFSNTKLTVGLPAAPAVNMCCA